MKISEAIAKLQEAQKLYGDVPFMVQEPEMGAYEEVTKLARVHPETNFSTDLSKPVCGVAVGCGWTAPDLVI